MIGLYFSGTGNTKYCIEKFMEQYDRTAKVISIEDKSALEEIKTSADIVFAAPVYYSNTPKIVRDFIDHHKDLFYQKNIFLIATMGLFSGDGTGCTARLLKKYKATVIGGLHLQMPDCISDVKLLKKTPEQNRLIVQAADKKIKAAAEHLKNGTPPKNGLGFLEHIAGLFGQRLWFYKKTLAYSDKLKIDPAKCIGCGQCAAICPMNNISIKEQQAVAKNRCTMCYRCISRCPRQAITLLGKTVYQQYRIENSLTQNDTPPM